MSTDAIERVNTIGRSQGQPMVATNFKYQRQPIDEIIEYESESDSKDKDNIDPDDG